MAGKPQGLRARKRGQTQKRLREAALRLFLENGYDATTLDDIAAAAGVSRRTIFYYFRSKDEIVFQPIDQFRATLVEQVATGLPDQPPLPLLRAAIIGLCSDVDVRLAMQTARLLHGTDELNTRRILRHMQLEAAIFEALCQRWPSPGQHPRLRFVAMMAIGALRLALDAWIGQDGTSSLVSCVEEAFDTLEQALEWPSEAPGDSGRAT
ncbi:TetR/AcrR family transcriptional regulator [Ancylobacter radicis]|uniref:TetR family transcriptional regulator n=1 Tax=Ancylobacter radicis TaxID=2836179 RepID=A0ABS5R8G3_9HYPH|nr:TetR/AcrR family transcriptional regulator [Ancylobacter radicis]MBS9477802.1 TetR family transcriptional regulator [Ancylobacter radicis]